MADSKTYRVYDMRTGRVSTVPASRMSTYDKWMADEADRQAVKTVGAV